MATDSDPRRERDPAEELYESRRPEREASTREATRRMVLVIATALLVALALYFAYQG
jgi:hypothetical protein